MYWQRRYLREGYSMDLNAVNKWDLPKFGLLGSLLLRVSGSDASGLGQSGGSWRIADFISKIEVIADGSTVIKSLTGKCAQALAVLDQGVMPPSSWRNYATNTQFEYYLVNFGRKLFDELSYLDLSKFGTVELWITNTATTSYFSDLTASIVEILLQEPGGLPAPFGYMRTEEWRSWTCVQDETKYNDLPTENIIRRILLQATPPVDSSYIEKTNMQNLMDSVLLTLETGKLEVFNGGIDDLMRENFYDLGKHLISVGYEYMFAGKGFDVSLGYVNGGAWGAGSDSATGASTVPTMEAARTSYTQKPITYEAGHAQGFVFAGMAPFLVCWFDFSKNGDPATWLDPDARKVVQLNIHTRNSTDPVGGTNKIILDRLVRY